jgi:hypothetical protein
MNTADVQQDGPWPRRRMRREWLRVARETGNPLLRRPTAAERRLRVATWSLLGVLALVTAAGCLFVLRAGLRQEQAEAGRRPVQVVVVGQLQPTNVSNTYPSDALLQVTYTVDGITRQGTMPSLFGAGTGTRMDAWVDRDAALVARPQSRASTVAQTLLAAIGGAVMLASLVLGARTGLAAWSMRLRSQEWDAEWMLLDTGSTH